MSVCPGEAFKTPQAQINPEKKKNQLCAKPFSTSSHFLLMGSNVISSHVDSIVLLFKTHDYNHPLNSISFFASINHPCVFLLSDQEDYLYALHIIFTYEISHYLFVEMLILCLKEHIKMARGFSYCERALLIGISLSFFLTSLCFPSSKI